ncbi:Uncharacterised protein [Candidatus Anstonella stagnisolia]|nr:Uncharacterised protein [Candidatus Anstonella stagnisolia]
MGSLYANWKLRDVKGQMQEADSVKEHFWVNYKFLGRSGARILRKEGTDANGQAIYYDYVSKLSGTLAKLSKRLGVTDAQVKESEKINFEKVKPRKVVQAAPVAAVGEAKADAGTVKREEPAAEAKKPAAGLKPQGTQEEEKPVAVQEAGGAKKEAERAEKKVAAGSAAGSSEKKSAATGRGMQGKEERKKEKQAETANEFAGPGRKIVSESAAEFAGPGGRAQREFAGGAEAQEGTRKQEKKAGKQAKSEAESWTVVNPYIKAGLVGRQTQRPAEEKVQRQPEVAVKQEKKTKVRDESKKETARAQAKKETEFSGSAAPVPEFAGRKNEPEVRQPAQNEAQGNLAAKAQPAKAPRTWGVSDAVLNAYQNAGKTVDPNRQPFQITVPKVGAAPKPQAVQATKEEKTVQGRQQADVERAQAREPPVVQERKVEPEIKARGAQPKVESEPEEGRQQVKAVQPVRDEVQPMAAAKAQPAKAPKAQSWEVSNEVLERYQNAGKTVDPNRPPFEIPVRKIGFAQPQGGTAGTTVVQAGNAQGRQAIAEEGVAQSEAAAATAGRVQAPAHNIIKPIWQPDENARPPLAHTAPSGIQGELISKQQLQEESDPLLKYYKSMGAAGEVQCAGYAFGYVLPKMLEREGLSMPLVAVSTWELHDYLPHTIFSERGFFAKGEVPQTPTQAEGYDEYTQESGNIFSKLTPEQRERVWKQLTSAPAGSLLTVRWGHTTMFPLRSKTPGHTLVCIGDGKWAENLKTNFNVWDMKNDAEFGRFLEQNIFVEGSRMFVPDFSRISPSKTQTRTCRESMRPEDFAIQLSREFHMPFEYMMGEILRQNGISKNFREKREGMSVRISVPDVKYASAESREADARWNAGMRTPALAYAGRQRTRFEASPEKLEDRRGEFVSHMQRLGQSRDALGISQQTFDALMVILYNEQYSSKSSFELRKYKENAAASSTFAFWAAEKLRGRINTTGSFQVDVDWVNRWLKNAQNRGELLNVMNSLGVHNTNVQESIGNWGMLDENDRRAIIAVKILGNEQLGLFFAGKIYNDNLAVLQGIAARYDPRATYEDVELTAVLAYNRGLPKTYAAIFQQNLLQAAQESGVPTTVDGNKLMVMGRLGDATFGVFKSLCAKKGISEVRMDDGKGGEQSVQVASMEIAQFRKIFGKYENIAAFFSREEFAGFDYKAVLDYSYLKLNPEVLTEYAKSYFFFIQAPENMMAGDGISRAGRGSMMY